MISSFSSITKQKIELQESYDAVEKERELLTEKTAKCARDLIEKKITKDKVNYEKLSLLRKNVQLNVKKEGLEVSLNRLEKEWTVKESETAFEKNRIFEKRKDAEEKIADKKRNERDLAEIAEMEYSIRKREKEVELMEIERNQLVQQEKLEREKIREDEINEILKRADDIASQNNKTTTMPPPSSPPPPNYKMNPFYRS